jgi:L-proline amide hydrolase
MPKQTTVQEGYAPFGEHRTWFRVTGNLDSSKVPLVVAHGGPGCTHDYVDSFKDLADAGRCVIHYDQIGNGRSTHLQDAPKNFWTVALFLKELDNLTRHLGIAQRYNLLGQSWGGMLASEHAVLRPDGLNALVLASSPSSMPVWVSEALRLRRHLPQDVQDTLARHEADGSYDHADYKAASDVFYNRHVCRLDVWPDEVKRTFAALAEDPTVYHAMNGPTEFHVIGTLKDWSVVPTLVISGFYDEATQACVEPYVRLIPNSRQIVMQNSAHMCHLEERTETMAAVDAFLSQYDLEPRS